MSVTVSIRNESTSSSQSAWAGAALGELLSHLWAPLMATTVTHGLFVEFACIALGYFIGKQHASRQQLKAVRTGKTEVKSPTFWNVGLAKGYLLAAVVNFILLYMAAFIGLKVSLLNAVMDVTTLALVVVGGLIEKHTMKDAYAEATRIEAKERTRVIMQSFDKARTVNAKAIEHSLLRTQA